MFAPECRAFFSHPAYFGRSECCLSDGVCLRYGEEGESGGRGGRAGEADRRKYRNERVAAGLSFRGIRQ